MDYREKFRRHNLLDVLPGGEPLHADMYAVAKALNTLSPTQFPRDLLASVLRDIERERYPLEFAIGDTLESVEPEAAPTAIARVLKESFKEIESEESIEHAIRKALEERPSQQPIVPTISVALRAAAPNWRMHFYSRLDDSTETNRDEQSNNLRALLTSLADSVTKLIGWVDDRKAASKSSSRQKVENLVNALGTLGDALRDVERDSLARQFVEQALLANELDLIEDELQEQFGSQEAPAVSPSDFVRAQLATWQTLEGLSHQANELGVLITRADIAPLTQTGRKQRVAEIGFIQSLVFLIRQFGGEKIKIGSSPTSRFNAFVKTMLALAGVHLSAEEIRNKIKAAKPQKKG